MKKIEQSSAEWSEEDEYILRNVTKDIERLYGEATVGLSANVLKQELDWLKSIRPQNKWKPSDEQMEAFRRVYDWYNINFMESETLNSLYEDMKKLKG